MTNLEQMRDAWDRYADAYDQAITELGMSVAEEARTWRSGPGARLLDVPTGGGALSIPAARRGARVLAVDFSPGMTARLRRRAEQEGLANRLSRPAAWMFSGALITEGRRGRIPSTVTFG